MDKFPYTFSKVWPYECTYTQIEQTSTADKEWLFNNVGSSGESWFYYGARSDANRGLFSIYGFAKKEDMVLFQLARCDTTEH